MENEIICVDNIRKKFKLSKKQQKNEKCKEKIALDGLSFKVMKGEAYALLGPNGAGKTTALRILATLMKPDDGDCIINGISVKDEPDVARTQIGFLTSELKLDGFFTPNYLYDFFSDLYGIPTNIKDIRKKNIFKIFGIDKFAEVKVEDLSTGMKQKVSIAISLVHDPDIIIFDEPTNGLDVITEKMVVDYLLKLKKEGKTLILSTHIFNLVEKIADRVGIIINGKMVYENHMIDFITENEKLEDVFFSIYFKEVGQDEK